MGDSMPPKEGGFFYLFVMWACRSLAFIIKEVVYANSKENSSKKFNQILSLGEVKIMFTIMSKINLASLNARKLNETEMSRLNGGA